MRLANVDDERVNDSFKGDHVGSFTRTRRATTGAIRHEPTRRSDHTMVLVDTLVLFSAARRIGQDLGGGIENVKVAPDASFAVARSARPA